MKNNINKTMFIYLMVIFVTLESSGQRREPNAAISLDSVIVLESEGLLFKGTILLKDSLQMPQVILFARSYDTSCFICSGNIELEFQKLNSFVPIVDSSLSNIPPLELFLERDKAYKYKRFEGVIGTNELKQLGRYRLRVRFYASKYSIGWNDIFSDWYFFDIPLSGNLFRL